MLAGKVSAALRARWLRGRPQPGLWLGLTTFWVLVGGVQVGLYARSGFAGRAAVWALVYGLAIAVFGVRYWFDRDRAKALRR